MVQILVGEKKWVSVENPLKYETSNPSNKHYRRHVPECALSPNPLISTSTATLNLPDEHYRRIHIIVYPL